jgi:hypothetical protein
MLGGVSRTRSARAALAAYLSVELAGSAGCRSCTDDPSSKSAPAASASELVEPPPRCLASRARAFEPAGVRGASSSSLDLVRAGDRTLALIADPDERALHVVDTKDMKQIGVTPLDGRPEHVVAFDDGRVMVTLRDPAGLVALEPSDATLAKPFEVRCEADAGNDPGAIARDARRIFVTSGIDAALAVLGSEDLDSIAVVHIAREPRGIVVDGPRGFVTHAVGGLVTVVDVEHLSSPAVLVPLAVSSPRAPPRTEPTDDEEPASTAPGRRTGQGYALTATVGTRDDGSRGTLRLFAPHTVSDTGPPASVPSGRYGKGDARTVAPSVAVVDTGANRMISKDAFAALPLPSPEACVLPRGVALHGDALYVACLDADVVLELDARLADPMSLVRKVHRSPQPNGIAVDGEGRLFVHSVMARRLTRHAPSGGEAVEIGLGRRDSAPRDEVWLRGRALFHTSRDARIGSGHACASCHPDGRDDGLVWSSPDGARQTPVLAGRIEGSAPYGWLGENATLRSHFDHTFERLGGTGFDSSALSASDVEALAKYVSSLALPARPRAERWREAVERGREVYVARGCEGCHPAGKSDGKTHDVGSGEQGDRRSSFDTPWLVGVHASPPYFHDGRYASLEDVLTAEHEQNASGTISAPDREALLAYLWTL